MVIYFIKASQEKQVVSSWWRVGPLAICHLLYQPFNIGGLRPVFLRQMKALGERKTEVTVACL